MSEEQQQPSSSGPDAPRRSGGRRRGRRGGRGRRRPSPAPGASVDAPVEPPGSAAPDESFEMAETGAPAEFESHEADAPRSRPSHPQPPRRRGSPLMQAADDVAEIVETLKQTLNQMEEVLELIELAERQKLIDEREIEGLRRQLRQLQSRRPD